MAQQDPNIIDIRPKPHAERRKRLAEVYRAKRIERQSKGVAGELADEQLAPETLALIQLADELAIAVLNDE